MSLRAAGFSLLVIALVIAPLIVGSTWMYQGSASTFAFEHNVRVAQHARYAVMKLYLATESDVRGFAATNDPYFARRFHQRVAAFGPLSATLETVIAGAGVSGGRALVAAERRAYRGWLQNVADPIVAKPVTRQRRLLRSIDPAYAIAMSTSDERLGLLLDDASAQAEANRQHLLRQILFASIVLVAVAAMIAAALLWFREVGRRRADVQRALYAEEQRVTAMLQAALAPDRLPAIAGVELHAIYNPAESERDVGGDWYEAFELLDGRAFLTIGDVAGHGLGAAVTMNKARQAILAAAVVEAEPAAILRRANRTLFAQSAGMVTAACCIFDPVTLRFDYATAGHPAPIVSAPERAACVLRSGGAPLGIIDDIEIDANSIALSPDSMVMLYTDGLIEEQRDVVAGEVALLAATRRHRTAADPARAIFDAVIGPRSPRDDVAVLTMTLQHSPAGRIEHARVRNADLPLVQRGKLAVMRDRDDLRVRQPLAHDRE